MAYYNNSHYYDLATTGASDAYPLPEMPAIGEDNYTQVPDSLAIGWGHRWSPETVAHAPSYAPPVSGYAQPPYSAPTFPRSQPESSNAPNWNGLFANTLTLGASDAMAVPNTYPPGYRGQNQSGPASWPYTFYPQNIQASYQPSVSLAETGLNSTGRFHPYANRTRTTRYANAEAEPPTVAPPYVQSGGQQIPEPSGGVVSETPANAETNNPITEQHEAPVKRNRASTAGFRPRRHQPEIDSMSPRLFAWAKWWNNGREPASFNEALTVALNVISIIRPPIRPLPYLNWEWDKQLPPAKRAERKRENELFEDISTRYPSGRRAWVRPDLLARVLEDLEEDFPPDTFKPSAS